MPTRPRSQRPAAALFDAADRQRVAAASESLIDWYLRDARDLPWRRSRDPYAILVSEVMLQQTLVEVVRDRWTEFLERFPTLEALAAAPEDEVLAVWSGLGYYRRARNLHQAAREVVERHAGRLPADRDALRALPGIGDYTSAAVAAIAFGLPVLSVDGNVARVLARWLATPEDARKPAVRRQVEALFVGPLEQWSPGELNQALMELGARICVPRRPRCEDCPCAASCRAREQGRERELPPTRTTRVRDVLEAAAVFEREGRVLLVRGQRPGQLSTMWEFPTLDSRYRPDPDGEDAVAEAPSHASGGLAEELAAHLGRRGLVVGRLDHLGVVRHGITDRRIECHVFRAAGAPRADAPGDTTAAGRAAERTWAAVAEIGSMPIAASTRKILELLAGCDSSG